MYINLQCRYSMNVDTKLRWECKVGQGKASCQFLGEMFYTTPTRDRALKLLGLNYVYKVYNNTTHGNTCLESSYIYCWLVTRYTQATL